MCDFSGKTLLVLGDSIMYGSGNGGKGVGEYLGERFGFILKKYCVGGARVGYYEGKNWLVEQVRSAILDGISPDYIIFDGFTNDCNMTDGKSCDVPLGEISPGFEKFDIFLVKKENSTFSYCFECIIHALKKYFREAAPLFVRPHKMGRRDAKMQLIYGERAVEICKKWGVAVADIYKDGGLDTFVGEQRDKYTNDTYGWGMGDCTHPNAAGYIEKYLPVIEAALIKSWRK